MFLRKRSRFKDGKRHDYWSVAENARSGTRVKFTAAPRIGIAYASKRDQNRKWRFTIKKAET